MNRQVRLHASSVGNGRANCIGSVTKCASLTSKRSIPMSSSSPMKLKEKERERERKRDREKENERERERERARERENNTERTRERQWGKQTYYRPAKGYFINN